MSFNTPCVTVKLFRIRSVGYHIVRFNTPCVTVKHHYLFVINGGYRQFQYTMCNGQTYIRLLLQKGFW